MGKKTIGLRLWDLSNIGCYDDEKIGTVIVVTQQDLSLEDNFLICYEDNTPVLIKMYDKVHVFLDKKESNKESFVNEEHLGLFTHKMISRGFKTITRKNMITYMSHYQNKDDVEKYLLDGFLLGCREQMVTFETESGALGAYIKYGDRVVIASRPPPSNQVLKDSKEVYCIEMMKKVLLAMAKD
jgi:hypothetical protein